MKNTILGTKIHSSWNDFYKIPANMAEIDKISETLFGKSYYPDSSNILRFQWTDISKAKCVILGMEPYPSNYKDENGQTYPVATGRSFEVANIDSWTEKFKQVSLWNILKTLYYNETGQTKEISDIRSEISNGSFNLAPPHKWFDSLEDQGVIFLNASLTVEPGKVGSHKHIWNDFMDDVIRYIVQVNPDIKWLIWGNEAEERIKGIVPEKSMIRSSHPRIHKFVEENCFRYIKDINWMG